MLASIQDLSPQYGVDISTYGGAENMFCWRKYFELRFGMGLAFGATYDMMLALRGEIVE